ncbi:inosine-5'-monophosphate dehydrogenase [Desulfocucumis palustris]|uniref:Inosine-5'-monophosphate dehydrogenase n=1 Tax=Desulfocucumis palustris TaxID=1898651 RepID=A0A2L2XFI3_9FIRM|nr:GGDEF domain-containing protein [Desulfocucumis palustris]GBF32611.1 inosine-5'-monophosphate dehydrogenase [Desulfocucumis palustris]
MLQIKDFMVNPVLTIGPGKSVLYAAEFMQEKNIGGLPVVEGNQLLGIITSRDIRLNHPNRIVADAMTKKVICCSPLDTTWDVAELMKIHRIERLPVAEKDRIVGIITKKQIIKYISQLNDHLTGLYNSSFIYMLASKILETGNEISVILFDINNFGEINKSYGHVQGDNCLKTIAGILQDRVDNNYDYVCRYGGDEFVIVTSKKIKQAEELANGIIDNIAEETPKTGIPVTVSAGISGGKRKYSRNTVKQKNVIENLINKASLASTKAKTMGFKYLIV